MTASPGMLSAVVLRILRQAQAVAAADPEWRGGPAEYDYLTAAQIAELIGHDRLWRTLGHEIPRPDAVLRQLRKLEREERVWTWEGASRDVPAASRHRWALATQPGGTA